MEGISVEKIIKYAEDSLEAAKNALDKADNVGIVNAYGNYMFSRGEFMMAMIMLQNVSMEDFINVDHKTADKNINLLFREEDLYRQLKALSTNADRAVE